MIEPLDPIPTANNETQYQSSVESRLRVRYQTSLDKTRHGRLSATVLVCACRLGARAFICIFESLNLNIFRKSEASIGAPKNASFTPN